MFAKRSRTSPADDAAIGSVIHNMDLLFEIFLRLPVISLIKFKLVSKSWLSLITDPEFGITHSRRNTIPSPVSDFYYQDRRRDVSISLDYHSSVPSMSFLEPVKENAVINSNPEIVHSCNGLILLVQRRTLCPIVINLTTQRYRIISPPFDLMDRVRGYVETDKCGFLLAFDPLKSHHYKVVMFREASWKESCSGSRYLVHIFSSQSGLWKELLDNASPAHSTRRIYFDGAIHWLNGFNNKHLQFDVDTEKMIETQLPPKPIILGRDKNLYFGESNSRFFLIQCRDSWAFGFMMLEMDAHTLHWDIKHHVNLRPLVLQLPPLSKCSFLQVKSGADRKSCSLILAIPGKIVLYEVKKDKSFKYNCHMRLARRPLTSVLAECMFPSVYSVPSPNLICIRLWILFSPVV